MDIIRTSSRTCGRLLLLTLLVAIGFAHTFVPQAVAAEYGLTASVGLSEKYNDNVYFEGKSDFVHEARPSLAAGVVTELTEFQIAASFDVDKYQDNHDLDSVSQFYDCVAKWAVTPRLSLNFTGTYVIDYTFLFALREQGIRTDRNQRNSVAGRPALIYAVGPRDAIEIAYEAYSENYDHPTERDFRGQEVKLGWLHSLMNERTTLKFYFAANQTDFDEDIDNPDLKTRDRTVSGSAGFEHKFTPTTTVEFSAGGRFTHSENRDGEHSTDQSAGFLGDFRLTKKWERSSFRARLTRDYAPSAFGQDATTDRASLDFSYEFTERLGFSLWTYGVRSNAQNEGSEDEKSWAAGVGSAFYYALTPKLYLNVGYNFDTYEDQKTNKNDSANQVWLGLKWNILEPEWKVRAPGPLVEWPYRY